MLFCCFTDSNKRIQTKVFKQKKHNHGFPRENNYIPLGYHGSILWIQQLFDPEDPTMVRSFGSNNCSIRRIQPWFDPLDPTIVRSGGSNHGSILFLTCPVVFVRDPTIISLNPFSSFFILFHPFSSLFFKKKKRAEKGRDRSDIMVFLRKTIISRRDIMRKGKVS